jgi:hypothetical protein
MVPAGGWQAREKRRLGWPCASTHVKRSDGEGERECRWSKCNAGALGMGRTFWETSPMGKRK